MDYSLLFYLLLNVICQAQIPVSQEPRHHKVLENDHVRLLDVHIPPGDTSMIHIHATPSVFVVLNNVKTGSQVISEEDHSKSPIPHYGNIWFEGFYEKPRIHRVWNSDTTEFHVMDIELTNKNYIVIDGPYQTGAFYIFIRRKTGAGIPSGSPTRAAKISILPRQGRYTDDPADRFCPLIGVIANEKDFQKKGDYLYITSGTNLRIRNQGPEKANLLFLN